MKKLSIIIPVYNKKKYLKKCLDSLVKYNNEHIEIILIDDGSTDSSNEIYQKYSEFIKIIVQKNHGVSFTRNVGINDATGEYIMFVDSDDYLEKNWFNVLIKNLDSEKDVILFSKDYYSYPKNFNEIITFTLNIESNNFHLYNPVSKIYRRDFLLNNKIYFDENIKNGEDMLFNLKCFLADAKIDFINQSYYCYYLNETSVARNFNEKELLSDILFQNKLHEILINSKKLKEEEIIYYETNLAINGLSYLLCKIAKKNSFLSYLRMIKKIDFNFYSNKIKYCKICNKKKKLVFILKKLKFNLTLFVLLKIKKTNNKNIVTHI